MAGDLSTQTVVPGAAGAPGTPGLSELTAGAGTAAARSAPPPRAPKPRTHPRRRDAATRGRAGGAAGRGRGAAGHAARPWRSEDDALRPQPALPAGAARGGATQGPPRPQAGTARPRRHRETLAGGGKGRGGEREAGERGGGGRAGAAVRPRLRATWQLWADPRPLSAEPGGVRTRPGTPGVASGTPRGSPASARSRGPRPRFALLPACVASLFSAGGGD